MESNRVLKFRNHPSLRKMWDLLRPAKAQAETDADIRDVPGNTGWLATLHQCWNLCKRNVCLVTSKTMVVTTQTSRYEWEVYSSVMVCFQQM